MTNTDISNENLNSYLKADYHIYFSPNFILKINKPSNSLRTIYKKFSKQSAAFLTAFNPFSQETSQKENLKKNKQLEDLLISNNYLYILGGGICPESDWPEEKSFLVLGMDLDTTKVIGNQFKQNAVLWIDSDTIPKLILLK